MQAGAAMAVVGWWTGYKLGGVISLNVAEFFEKQVSKTTGKLLLVLGMIIFCNIGLLFVNEPQPIDRKKSKTN